jgi:hypothetical protein
MVLSRSFDAWSRFAHHWYQKTAREQAHDAESGVQWAPQLTASRCRTLKENGAGPSYAVAETM